jgi:hypothetical protein
VDDGRLFLARHPEQTWDVIVVDVFTGNGVPPAHMATREFLAEARDRLAPGGVLLMVIECPVAGTGDRMFASLWATLAAVFDEVWAFPRSDLDEPRRRADWGPEHWSTSRDILLVGTTGDGPTRAALQAGVLAMQAAVDAAGDDYWTSELFFVPRHAANVIAPEDWADLSSALGEDPRTAGAPVVFTDDFAPIEQMLSRPGGRWQ